MLSLLDNGDLPEPLASLSEVVHSHIESPCCPKRPLSTSERPGSRRDPWSKIWPVRSSSEIRHDGPNQTCSGVGNPHSLNTLLQFHLSLTKWAPIAQLFQSLYSARRGLG